MFLGSYLIIAVSVFFLVGVIVTYVLSVSTGHIKLFWCFISYTGNFPVESCIFSAVLNLCSGMYFLIVTLRYCQVSEVIDNSDSLEKSPERMKRWNKISLAIGLIGTIGLSITGCFQQRNLYFMHMLGVFCCTCGTNAYMILQTYFSYTVLSSRTTRSLKTFRLVTVILSSAVLVTGSIFALYFFSRHPRRLITVTVPTPGGRSNLFKIGTVLEWVLFFLIQFFIYSLYSDFKKIALQRNRIIFLE